MLISPDDPLIADPAVPIELWYDTNDQADRRRVRSPAGRSDRPASCEGQSDVDGETEWTGAAGDSAIVGDNAGFLTAGGGGIFKKTGGGIVLRRHNNNAEIPIENNDGSNARNIIHAGGGTFVNGAILQFANQADIAKINLYSTTFGFGVTSGTLDVFASSTVKFKQNSITGTLWAYIDATCGGGRVLTDATGAPKNPGWVACTMASGISGSAHYKDLGGAYGIKYAVNKAGGERRRQHPHIQPARRATPTVLRPRHEQRRRRDQLQSRGDRGAHHERRRLAGSVGHIRLPEGMRTKWL